MSTLCEFLPGLEEPNIIIAKKNKDCTYEGSPCSHGHTIRYTLTDRCVDCKKEYYWKNREKILKQKQRYFLENIEKIAKKDAKYYKENKEKIIKQKVKYYRERYQTDELFRIKEILRSQLRSFCKNRSGKKEGRTHELLGYSAKELKDHLESLFKKGMSWANQGKWHIDHKIPQSYFKSIDQMKECFALENLKPEWGEWNRWKSNRFIG